MKIFILSMFLSLSAFGEEIVPIIFKDSNIERKLKDGTIQRFDGNKYKIVPRKKIVEKQPKQLVKIIRTTRKIIRIKPVPNNYFSVWTGYDTDMVFGLGYDKKLTHSTTLRFIGISNGTGMIGVGFGF